MKNYKPESRLLVSGKMSEEAADKVGNKFADAALILASCGGVAALIAAVRWW